MKFALAVVFVAVATAQSWMPQESGTTASLRGVSAVSATVAWASGSNGTFLRTTDGGAHWRVGKIPGASDLDFRGVQAIDENTAYLLSIGAGEKSRVYKTVDAGGRWSLMYTNPDPKGFFDALALWDADHGILLGDPVNGRFVVMTTSDGGGTWKRQKTPSALSGEGAFAASNTCLLARGTREAWFGTGGARVFHTTDAGRNVVRRENADSKRFAERGNLFAGVLEQTSRHRSRRRLQPAPRNRPRISRSRRMEAKPGRPRPAVRRAFDRQSQYSPEMKEWIATGTSGSDISSTAETSWKHFDTGNYNAISFASGAGWAVGPKGAIAKWRP